MAGTRIVRVFQGIFLLALGALLGPIAVALIYAIGVATFDEHSFGGTDRPATVETNERAAHLFHVYEPYRPPARPWILYPDVQPPLYEQCGYESLDRQLYGWAQRNSAGSPRDDERYSEQSSALGRALMIAAHYEQDNVAIARLAQSTSDFSATFLASCIEGTVFRDLCVSKVKALLDGDQLRLPHELPSERSIFCTFFDGVAARTGVALPDRP